MGQKAKNKLPHTGPDDGRANCTEGNRGKKKKTPPQKYEYAKIEEIAITGPAGQKENNIHKNKTIKKKMAMKETPKLDNSAITHHMNLEELSMPGIAFVRQLNHYSSIACRKPDNRAVSIAWHCGKSWGIPF